MPNVLELAKKLRQRISTRRYKQNVVSKAKTAADIKAANASKPDRAAYIHWSNFEDGSYKNVGVKDFWGNREVRFFLKWTKYDLLKEAKTLFFEDGMSTKGKEEDCL